MRYTTKEVALKLGVTTQTVINWTNRGLIPCQRTPGGHRRYDENEINKFSEQYLFTDTVKVTASNDTRSENVVILTQDADYARLISDYLQVCFKGFHNAHFTEDSFKLVSNPFRASYWIGASKASVVIIDVEFLTSQIKTEIEWLVQRSHTDLKKIVVLCRLGQADEIRNWSFVDSIHLRNKPLSQLVMSFSDVFEPTQDIDGI